MRENKTADSKNRIIINADDFGMSPGVNQAIEQLHQIGRLTSVSIMTNMPLSSEALTYAQEAEELKVGVHLNLTTGRPLLPAEKVPSLVNAAGKFYSLPALLPRLLTGVVRQAEMQAELTAQMERCLDHGLQPQYVDSHVHLHALPAVGNLVAQLIGHYGITAIRNPDFSAFVIPPTGHPRLIEKTVRRTRANLLRTTQDVISRKNAPLDGLDNRSDQLIYLRWYLRRGVNALDSVRACFTGLEGRTLEIIAHPAVADEALPALSGYVKGREQELELLGSDQFFALLSDFQE